MSKFLVSILAGLGGMLGWGSADFFAKKSVDKFGHLKTYFFMLLVGGIAIVFLIPLFGLQMNFTTSDFVLMAFCALFYIGGYLFFYKALEVGTVSVVSPLISIYPLFTILVSLLLFNQRLVGLQIPAVIIIMFGAILISIDLDELKKQKFNLKLGVKETLVAVVLFGLFYYPITEYLVDHGRNWFSLNLVIRLFSISFLALFMFIRKEKINVFRKNKDLFFLIILIGLLDVFGYMSNNYGFSIGDAVIVTPIASCVSLVTVGLSIVFLKEKPKLLQILSILLIVSGIILISI